nr:MAG TPA: hypothetical protein [Caudoviricetes sp.]DAX23833.1 MAG TPA: hypothetical protein [Caudoviricetes sp.]
MTNFYIFFNTFNFYKLLNIQIIHIYLLLFIFTIVNTY